MSEKADSVSKSLRELVDEAQSGDVELSARAEAELYERTRRFVFVLVREARDDRYRHQITTQWLANAAEKSFLSYVKKKDWRGDVPEDAVLFAILRTISRRIVLRELDRLSPLPTVSDWGSDSLLDGINGNDAAPVDEASVVDFLEFFKNRVRKHGDQAIDVIGLAMEGQSRVEICDELNIGRGKLSHLVAAIRNDLALALAEQEDPRSLAAYRMSQNGTEVAEIADTLDVSTQWVQHALASIEKMLGKK